MKDNVINFIKKYKVGLVIVLFLLVAAIPLTIFQLKKIQDTRSRASGGQVAVLLTPLTKTVRTGDNLDVQVTLNGGDNDISAVDITFTYDSELLEPASQSGQVNPFAPITGGFLPITNTLTTPGTVHFVGVNPTSNPITGANIPLGTFHFTAKAEGDATIGFSNIHINGAGVASALPVDSTNTKIGHYTISDTASSSCTGSPCGPNNPSSVSEATNTYNPWTNLNNILASDDTYASVTFPQAAANGDYFSNYIVAKGFGFNIPADATITGIKIEVEKKANAANGIIDQAVYLTANGGTPGSTPPSDASSNTAWGTADSYSVYGGPTSLWGTAWTPAQINSANFGFIYSVRSFGSTNTASIDHIRATVYYTGGSATPTPTPTLTPVPSITGDEQCAINPGSEGCSCIAVQQGNSDPHCNTGLVCTNNVCRIPLSGTPTPTSGSTPTPTGAGITPTITPVTTPVAGVNVSLTLSLPGIGTEAGGNNTPKQPTRAATVALFDSKGEQVKTATGAVIYGNGVYKGIIPIGALSAGSYEAKVKMDNTLWKRIPGILVVSSGTQVFAPATLSLIPGDISATNVIDLSDYNAVLACYKGTCQGNTKTQADFNDDGVIDTKDLNILLRAFANRQGD